MTVMRGITILGLGRNSSSGGGAEVLSIPATILLKSSYAKSVATTRGSCTGCLGSSVGLRKNGFVED